MLNLPFRTANRPTADFKEVIDLAAVLVKELSFCKDNSPGRFIAPVSYQLRIPSLARLLVLTRGDNNCGIWVGSLLNRLFQSLEKLN